MLDPIWKWIGEHQPVFLAFIIILVGVVFISWRAFQIFHRFKKTESDCETLVPKIDAIGKNVKTLVFYLKHKDQTLDPTLFESHSPVTLTPFGSKLLDASGGKQFVDDHLAELFKEIEADPIKSPLDVENNASNAILKATTLDSFAYIKDFIYNNPIFREGGLQTPLDVPKIANILGIYLRDKYFEKYPHTLK
jgi:hypothetical protein